MGKEGKEEASPGDVVKWLESPEGEAWRYENIEMVGTTIARIKPDNELHAGGAADCGMCSRSRSRRAYLKLQRERELNYFRAEWNPSDYPECA